MSKNLHFIGIGGAGMSALAQISLQQGHKVSGSDIKESFVLDRLRRFGADIKIGHKASNLPEELDAAVYSGAISIKNPEMAAALNRKIELLHRAQFLGGIMNRKKGIAVTGTHGKSTTSSLIAYILKEAGFNPCAAIGADADFLDGNGCWGEGEHFIAEADESDGSFIHLKPLHAIITNIGRDHLEYYSSLEEMLKAYRSFIDNIREGGSLIYCAEDKNIGKILKGYKRVVCVGFGISSDADVRADNLNLEARYSEFDCIYKKRRLGRVSLNIPGLHNVYNALAAMAVSLETGVDFENIKKAFASYKNVDRRFQIKGIFDGVMVVDDYAHHPAEIEAVLKTARAFKPGRIGVVFQPHRFTRTKYLADEFVDSLIPADYLFLTEIYPASEEPIEGVSSQNIYERVVKAKGHREDTFFVRKQELTKEVLSRITAGDLLLILGAGDISEVVDEIVGSLI